MWRSLVRHLCATHQHCWSTYLMPHTIFTKIRFVCVWHITPIVPQWNLSCKTDTVFYPFIKYGLWNIKSICSLNSRVHVFSFWLSTHLLTLQFFLARHWNVCCFQPKIYIHTLCRVIGYFFQLRTLFQNKFFMWKTLLDNYT